MDGWEALNVVRRWFYCGESKDYAKALENLSVEASKSNDVAFIGGLLQLKRDSDAMNTKRKLLWLTSKVEDRFYPPLEADLAGPLQWNHDIVLQSKSDKILSIYCLRKALVADTLTSPGSIQQSRDIENCSFVASMIVIKNQKVSLPLIVKVGPYKYHVNLNFNGSNERLVTVDISSIPTTKRGKQLAVLSEDLNDKIIELAYLQVTTGSYDCPGSNFAIDMFTLTGYIPEIVDAKRYSVKKLIEFYRSGFCYMAIGTGDNSGELENSLIKNHDYPIVGINEDSCTILARDTLDVNTTTDIDDMCLAKYYKQVYLVRKTDKLFSRKSTLHFVYKSDKYNKFKSIFDKPKFVLRNGSQGMEPIWILLETNLQCKNNSGKNNIAYLKKVPKNPFIHMTSALEGACEIGLQLLKLELPSNSDLRLFCHSSNTAHFTIHTFFNSGLVTFNRDSSAYNITSLQFSRTTQENYPLGSLNYFRNPTFKFELVHSSTVETSVHLQLLSETPHDLLNLSVFNFNDHTLSTPLLCNTDYTHQRYDKLHTPLITNTTYKIVCSTYSEPLSQEYKLVVAPPDDTLLPPFKCDIQQVFLEYGGYNYNTEQKIQWRTNSNRVVIPLSTATNNICFIRIVPKNELLLIRCNVFDSVTHRKICGNDSFQRVSAGGIVLEKVEIYGHPSVTLLIEKDEPIGLREPSKADSFSLIIGSHHKITIDV